MAAPFLMRLAAGAAGAVAGYKGAKKLDEKRPVPAPAPSASGKVVPAPTPAPAPAPAAPAKSSRRKEFEQEFAAARKRGDTEFDFYGKSYSTRLEGEKDTAHSDKMEYARMIRSAERARGIKS